MEKVTLRQCVILVGDLGSRFGVITPNTPKPLLQIDGRPFLIWLMRELVRFGVKEFVLLISFLSDQVEQVVAAIKDDLPHFVEIVLVEELVRAGTGGALLYASHLLRDRFLLCNGDCLLNCNLANLLRNRASDSPETIGRMLLRAVYDASSYPVVALNGDRVTAFRERYTMGEPAVINAGLYAFDRRVLDFVSPSCSLEQDVLPRLAMNGALRGTLADGWFVDIGIPADLDRARANLCQQLRRPALFLDRDGVLNHDHGWVGTQERWDWMPGAREAVALATNQNWHVFVVTNQSGIARGHYDEAAFAALSAWMEDEIRRAGGTIDDLRYCPYHPEASVAEYRRVSDWRKPSPGMLIDLIKKWDLDPTMCLLVGDQLSDLAAASAAGVQGHLFPGGNLESFVKELFKNLRSLPDHPSVSLRLC